MKGRSTAIRSLLLTLFLVSFVSRCVGQSPYVCNEDFDNCPYKRDGECDNEFGLNILACVGGDCYDCDRCRTLSNDCTRCVLNGCFWCPDDGTCASAPSDNFGSTCTKKTDFVRTCGSDETYLCEPELDTCPFRVDGECDNEYGLGIPECTGGDCFDCDPCTVFNRQCSTCLDNGCHWCPGDATCSSQKYVLTDVMTSCIAESDYAEKCEHNGYFSDPLYPAQVWVYDMINVIPVWKQGITGLGSRVRVNDFSIDSTHPEFAGRFDRDGSCRGYFSGASSDAHGTYVASIIGAAANNGECAVGIAPGATISGCDAFEGDSDFLDENLDMFDISQNAFGIDACINHRRLQEEGQCPFSYRGREGFNPCDVCVFSSSNLSVDCMDAIFLHCSVYYEHDQFGCVEFLDILVENGRCDYNTLTDDQRERITNGILNGRDGKGIVYIFASGNEYPNGEDVNFEGFLNTRFTIVVGAVGKDGLHASYSTPGAAIFVTAPGGDFDYVSHQVVAEIGGGCGMSGAGTSFSSPVVSGVVALMLEANPNLGWRDVQGILALTSKMVENDPDDDSKIMNAAGYKHSNLYGFGIVDAEAAVNASKSWEIFEEESMLVGESGDVKLILPDDPVSVLSSSVKVTTDADDFIVESVAVFLDLRHVSRGNLDIVLTSPGGTVSVLHPGKRPEQNQPDRNAKWKLLTVRNWGESAVGDWTLTIADSRALTCVDHPYSFFVSNVVITCRLIEAGGTCIDGKLNESFFQGDASALIAFTLAFDDNGRTPLQACCICGGGVIAGESLDQLMNWQIVVYGRAILSPADTSEVPSSAPTEDSGNGCKSVGASCATASDCCSGRCVGILNRSCRRGASTVKQRASLSRGRGGAAGRVKGGSRIRGRH